MAAHRVLTVAQADGLACVDCNLDYLATPARRRPVGRSHTGSQIFTCTTHDTNTPTPAHPHD